MLKVIISKHFHENLKHEYTQSHIMDYLYVDKLQVLFIIILWNSIYIVKFLQIVD